ncbi:glutathione-specific gamma-glutamylcyclotransferase 1 [Prorops nasuta]|uniref:glutathione-specific gamma-glutamylcyclotransferase 1 n=1 Tax=Prorops nasuta TaxID=863751 RepID=UPI0034CE8E27
MEEMANEDSGLWIFGYGSLCWNPGFQYKRSVLGYIKGFKRRFWQGNITHRGSFERPGRVATLVEDRGKKVYGRAFLLKDTGAIPYLNNRECSLGGYLLTYTNFYSRDDSGQSLPALIYIATEKNQFWLGEAPLHCMANQIIECSGTSGHNVEYLLRLAEFMHRNFPGVIDDHLFDLELLVRSAIKEQKMCIKSLMGSKDYTLNMEDREDFKKSKALTKFVFDSCASS